MPSTTLRTSILAKLLLPAAFLLTACSAGPSTIVVIDGPLQLGVDVPVTINGSAGVLQGGQIFVNTTEALERRVLLEGVDPYVVEGDKITFDLTATPADCQPVLWTNLGVTIDSDEELDSPAPGQITAYDSLKLNGRITPVGDCTGLIITVE